MNCVKKTMSIAFIFLCLGAAVYAAAQEAVTDKAELTKISGTEIQVPDAAETKAHSKWWEKYRTAGKAKARLEEQIAKLDVPEDTPPRLTVRELRITGNTLIPTAELLEDMPLIYNASDKPLHQAESGYLYDFRVLHDIISQPGQPRQVSARTILGFIEYILSVYRDKDYAGISVYVPEEAIKGRVKLQDDLLPVEVLEAPISEITVTTYDAEHKKVEKGLLSSSAVRAWSPAKTGQVANQKQLNDFVNLLNLNPDRYVSAIISEGPEPNSFALGYNIYEANPCHYYVQVDNSGTRQRQWAPRVGLINTNLTGRDDRFTAVYQAPWESGIEDNYSLFGSYEFPVLTPRRRLSLYGGHSEFDITPEGGPFNFLGRGSFYGGILRYNLFQTSGWFFDVTTSLSHERSKVTPALFPTAASDVKMNLWGTGVDIYRSDDMSNISFAFKRLESIGGGSDRDEFVLARRRTSPDFRVYTASAAHSRYLDPDKVQRLSGSFRFIGSSGRLVPAKMTTFGGLYSVRGYDEDEVVADGGLVASVQYEFDLVKHNRLKETGETKSKETQAKKPWLRKLAPLVFVDYGRAKIKDHIAGEKGVQKLCSIGVGTAVELGENFSGAIYYGWPLRSTDDTNKGEGRLNISLIYRF